MKNEMTDFVSYREPFSSVLAHRFLHDNSARQSIPAADKCAVERLGVDLHHQEFQFLRKLVQIWPRGESEVFAQCEREISFLSDHRGRHHLTRHRFRTGVTLEDHGLAE